MKCQVVSFLAIFLNLWRFSAATDCLEAGVRPNPTDCQAYIICHLDENGSWDQINMNCPPSMAFNPVALVCDFESNVICKGKVVQDQMQVGSRCHHAGQFFQTKSCSREYFECVQQVDGHLHPVRFECGPGTVFNMHDLDCDYPTNTPSCHHHPTEVPPTTTHKVTTHRPTTTQPTTRPTTKPSTSTATTTATPPQPSTITSPVDPNKVCQHPGLNPDPTVLCSRHFYDCERNPFDEDEWIVNDLYCPVGTFFDGETQRCLYDSQCPTTPKPMTTTPRTSPSTTPRTSPRTTHHVPTTERTTPQTTSIPSPSDGCQREGQLLPDNSVPKNCTIYYSCHKTAGGTWEVIKCTCNNGLIFDPTLEVCTWPNPGMWWCAEGFTSFALKPSRPLRMRLAGFEVNQPEACNA